MLTTNTTISDVGFATPHIVFGPNFEPPVAYFLKFADLVLSWFLRIQTFEPMSVRDSVDRKNIPPPPPPAGWTEIGLTESVNAVI